MVHALKEIVRVLVPGGNLIDLRPFNETVPVDVITGDESYYAGIIDGSHEHPDDLAANAAIKQVTVEGLFAREASDSFDLFSYWDSAANLKTWMDERSSSILPPETLAEAGRLMTMHGPNARIRNHLNMIIARYRKL